MGHATRDHERLARAQLDRPSLEVDQQPPVDDIEELVLLVVRVPVALPTSTGTY